MLGLDLSQATVPTRSSRCRGNDRFPYTGWPATRPGSSLAPPAEPVAPAGGQSSQMSPVSVIVADPCRVRSGLAVPVIVVILLSW